jgi:hypothetical protein
MCDYEWFNSYVEAILSDYVNRIVDLGSRTADLSPDVVLCNLVTDELGDGVRTYGVCDPESYLDMHLGKIAIELILHHFVYATFKHRVFLCDCLADIPVGPWISGGSNSVPPLCLPLVSLLTCR